MGYLRVKLQKCTIYRVQLCKIVFVAKFLMIASPYLTKQEESLLTNWCVDLVNCGFPVNTEELTNAVKKIIDSTGRKTPFVENKPGRSWMNGFLKRNPILRQRQAESISKGRAVVTIKSIKKWFRELEEYLESIGHKDILNDPKRIFNGDESGFLLCPKSGKVLAPRGSSHVYQVQNGNEKENITVLFVISADGNYAPPLVVFPYVRVPQNLMSTIPDEWCVGRSETGWMKITTTHFRYIANGLKPWLIKNSIEKEIILFVDGHTSHLNLELSNFCKDNKIILYALPPNTTQCNLVT
uniref:CSON006613 protein n=1 Tax=Culicoides sonorensis TaxID=179676 RepID=A0A336L8I1_CULSO